MSEEQKLTHARKLNMARRHLDRGQKNELIQAQLIDTPQVSDRQIAKDLGVSNSTVSICRKSLESSGELCDSHSSIGIDGKERPRQIERKQVSVFLPTSKHEEKTNTIIRAAAAGDEAAIKAVESLATLDTTPRTAKSELKKIEERQIIKPISEIPLGKFRTIVADPPWRYNDTNTRAAAEKHYDTMSIEELCNMPIRDCATDDAHLYLWTTTSFIREAYLIAESWGFQYKTLITWVKTGNIGLGHYFRVNTEHVLFCIRGNMPLLTNNTRNYFESTPEGHSTKPETFFQIVEANSPGPYIELFARRQRPGWSVWGNEANV
jgi:N6-adenosine-specific RNA methylase IME4/transposase